MAQLKSILNKFIKVLIVLYNVDYNEATLSNIIGSLSGPVVSGGFT